MENSPQNIRVYTDIFYSVRERNIVMSVSVCLSVCKHISETTRPNFVQFYRRVACGSSSRQRCNALPTSGFVDNVMFSYSWPYGDVTLLQQIRYNVVRKLAPLLRGIGCVLSWTTAGVITRFPQLSRV